MRSDSSSTNRVRRTSVGGWTLVLMSAVLVSPIGAQTPSGTAPSSPDIIIEPPVPVRYSPIEIEVPDSDGVRAGIPVRITITAVAKFATPHARLYLSLPDVEAIAYMQQHGVGVWRTTSRIPIVWQGPTPVGPLRHTVLVTFPVTGLYQMTAQLTGDGPSPDPRHPSFIQNGVETTAWIDVTPTGGHLIRSFESMYHYQQSVHPHDPMLEFRKNPAAAATVADSIPVVE